jgi:hypothetical protein
MADHTSVERAIEAVLVAAARKMLQQGAPLASEAEADQVDAIFANAELLASCATARTILTTAPQEVAALIAGDRDMALALTMFAVQSAPAAEQLLEMTAKWLQAARRVASAAIQMRPDAPALIDEARRAHDAALRRADGST